MSKDFDDIYKRIDQAHKDLYKKDNVMSKDIDTLIKNQEKTIKDITDIKKQMQDISFKVDLMLEILNSFTIMLAEEEDLDDDSVNEYDTDQTWVPNEDDWKDDEET